jgi:transcriptional regulator with XRE-family HTH domain
MSAKSLSKLGTMVRKKRGEAKLRDTAEVIGISAATLMRVENGRIPDVATFGKLCNWLGENPADFLGYKDESAKAKSENSVLSISAHFKADETPKPETVNALAKMILLAIKSQTSSTEDLLSDENS